MRVAIMYPPFLEKGKRPLLSQNRQFRYSSSSEVKIYPLIPATAATFVSQKGHDVLWLDGMNDLSVVEDFERRLLDFGPHVLLMETKAPLIKKHWDYTNYLKELITDIKIVFCGDHVSFFPDETLKNSYADFVLVGGLYDYTFTQLVEFLSGRRASLPCGCHYRDNGDIKNTGSPELDIDLDSLPIIDRHLTRWDIYGEAYLKKPSAYILTGRGCKGAKGASVCSFCIWQQALWRFNARLRSPENVVKEIKHLVEDLGVAEIFDDNESGPVWNVDWLQKFSQLMKKEGLVKKVCISSNARADLLTKDVCKLLKECNFRLLKVGIESGSERILRSVINKKEGAEDIKKGIRTAKDFGLIVLMTNMVGYPDETEDEAELTRKMAKELLLYKARAGDSLQASVLVPYPGTILWKKAIRNNWFIEDPYDYEKFDMAHVLVKSNLNNPMEWCNKLWKLHLHPKFILRSLVTARSFRDINLLWTGFKSLLGHLKDF
jgi:radical SAM superfamily enzyme YgiQ (UPF0313 family)